MTYQAKQYAHALFQFLPTKEEFEQAISLLKGFKRAYETDVAIRRFFDNPNISFDQKKELILRSLGENKSLQAPKPVVNLIVLMAQNSDLFKLSKAIYILKKIGDKEFDILEIRVTTAAVLTDDIKGLLQEKFREHEGQTVVIREKVDEHILGGVKVKVHDTLYDASIPHTLEHLLTHQA